MTNKRFTIILTFPHSGPNGDLYRIHGVEGNTEFKPGGYMNEDEVNELCKHPSWAVKMRYNGEPR